MVIVNALKWLVGEGKRLSVIPATLLWAYFKSKGTDVSEEDTKQIVDSLFTLPDILYGAYTMVAVVLSKLKLLGSK